MPEPHMDKAISDKLPDREVEYHGPGHKAEVGIDPSDDLARTKRSQPEEYCRINSQQPDHRPSEGREAQRHFSTATAQVSTLPLAVDTQTQRSGKGTTGTLWCPGHPRHLLQR